MGPAGWGGPRRAGPPGRPPPVGASPPRGPRPRGDGGPGRDVDPISQALRPPPPPGPGPPSADPGSGRGGAGPLVSFCEPPPGGCGRPASPSPTARFSTSPSRRRGRTIAGPGAPGAGQCPVPGGPLLLSSLGPGPRAQVRHGPGRCPAPSAAGPGPGPRAAPRSCRSDGTPGRRDAGTPGRRVVHFPPLPVPPGTPGRRLQLSSSPLRRGKLRPIAFNP